MKKHMIKAIKRINEDLIRADERKRILKYIIGLRDIYIISLSLKGIKRYERVILEHIISNFNDMIEKIEAKQCHDDEVFHIDR